MSHAAPSPGSRFWSLRTVVIAIPFLWLLLFCLVPFLIVLKISWAAAVLGQPPYTPLLATPSEGALQLDLHGGNYLLLAQDSLYLAAYLGSLKVAGVGTLLCLLLGYPMAYAMTLVAPRWRLALVLAIMLPFWSSFLLRVYALIGLLKDQGWINSVLLAVGLIDTPLPLLHNDFAVYVGVVYSYLPFMVLPLYATLLRRDPALLEAAADLGCPPWRAFFRITLPLSLPGVLAGCLLVFVPAVGEFVIPDMLGGPDTLMIGKVLWNEFFSNRDWPVAAAITVVMLMLLVVPIALFQGLLTRHETGRQR